MFIKSQATLPLLAVGAFVCVSHFAGSANADTVQVTNPLIQQRADPDIFRHTDGYYYFTATVPAYDNIELRRGATIQSLAMATPTVIWTKHSSGIMGAHIWAPELHYVNGSWYIYFAAGSTSDTWAIHIYVLENTSTNPLQGTWKEKGQIVTNWESMALDSTTFEYAGTRYLVWAQNDTTLSKNSSIFIAPMTNPWTLASPGVRISRPEFSWETAGAVVNEGPAVLLRNGKIFIAYSASATDANYCIGLLTASATSNLLSASSWNKSPTPVFRSGNGVYGPGHNQFTTSPDGTVDLLVYHARDYAAIPTQYGSSLNDPNRHTRVQQLNWNSDGTPNFGVPVANGAITLGSGGTLSVGGGTNSGGGANSGGASNSGGKSSTSGVTTTGGASNAGGNSSGSGASNTSGRSSFGGAENGGNAFRGGETSTGGATTATGGAPYSGGAFTAGGSTTMGGAPATGGAASLTNAGATSGNGGATNSMASPSFGGSTGGAGASPANSDQPPMGNVSGCSCSVATPPAFSWFSLGMAGLVLLRSKRRRSQ